MLSGGAGSFLFLDDGSYLDTAPKRGGNIGLGWNASQQTRAELEWLHKSEYYLNNANTFKYEAHDVFNLYISHDVKSKLTVNGRVQKLIAGGLYVPPAGVKTHA